MLSHQRARVERDGRRYQDDINPNAKPEHAHDPVGERDRLQDAEPSTRTRRARRRRRHATHARACRRLTEADRLTAWHKSLLQVDDRAHGSDYSRATRDDRKPMTALTGAAAKVFAPPRTNTRADACPRTALRGRWDAAASARWHPFRCVQRWIPEARHDHLPHTRPDRFQW